MFRIVWGFIGTKYARFTDFVYSPKTTIDYLLSYIGANPKHYIGHNPLGGWMIVMLLLFLIFTTWSGLEAYGKKGKGPLAVEDMHAVSVAIADEGERVHDKNDNDNEDEFWEEIHEFFANFTLFLVFVHIVGILISSSIHRENLIKAMITGKKQLSSE